MKPVRVVVNDRMQHMKIRVAGFSGIAAITRDGAARMTTGKSGAGVRSGDMWHKCRNIAAAETASAAHGSARLCSSGHMIPGAYKFPLDRAPWKIGVSSAGTMV